MRRLAFLLALFVVGCGVSTTELAPASALNVRYQLIRKRELAQAQVATNVYRGLLGKSMYSQCQMVPNDSRMFEARAKRCGALRAAVLGISRLLLERAATPEFLRPVRLEGRLKWIDLPDSSVCDF